MSRAENSDTSGTFVWMVILFIIGSLVCGVSASTTIPAMIALYFMLVATNSIARGENRARRQTQQKFNKR